MRVVLFDCWGGASGDMLLGALIDAGANTDRLNSGLDALGLGLSVSVERVRRAGFAALKADVLCDGKAADEAHPAGHHHRGLSEILQLLAAPVLDSQVRARATAVFERLAAAEAGVHGVTPESVHFHEVGALDAVGDVVGTCLCLADLGVEEVLFSALPTGGGTVRSAHGELPVPAPATLKLMEGLRVYDPGVRHEMVTPTGAALLTALGHQAGQWPAMSILATGAGAGRRDTPRANIVRAVVGEVSPFTGGSDDVPGWDAETVFVVETNVDDTPGQVVGAAVARLLCGGALDAWWSPCGMKKGRPGVQVSCLVPAHQLESAARILFAELPTLGVRMHQVQRYVLSREFHTVATPWGGVQVKVGRLGGAVSTVSPEYEDCRRLASRAKVPVRAVLAAAAAAAAAAGLTATVPPVGGGDRHPR
ncbi:MAG: nickel pincer cofactor biosynthesis protein LarC [Bacillota bacterium]|nr:nickel pincer cofactor biosynthesis protein LarC [Bacillota bacterium]